MDERILHFAKGKDEIWHCGDFGSLSVINELEKIAPLKGVYGNIDSTEIRKRFPEVLRFKCEEVEVLMIHIGGYPKKYTPLALKELSKSKTDLFISGHSHILKALPDKDLGLLHLNPGAAGKVGWHQKRTLMSFEISGKEIENLVVIELGDKTEKG